MINKKKIQFRIALLILFIFGINLVANKFHLYYTIWWFDMPMHFLGGFWIGLLASWWLSLSDFSFKNTFKIILVVFLVAIGWEIFESMVDKVITQNPFNLLDTLSDVCFGLSGGIFSTFYFWNRICIKKE